MFSLESFARDDNPTGNTVAEFPTTSEIESGNSVMKNNRGTISRAISSGEILYNFGTIDSLEGATVQENCNGATINKALGGTVTIEGSGMCILTGTNSGTMLITGVVYTEGEYYKLILNNISSNDIRMISNYKIDGTDIYVLKDDYFSFTFDDSQYSVMWSDGSSVHSTSVDSIRGFEDETHKYVDDTAKTVILHIHTFGSCVPSEIVETRMKLNLFCSGSS